MAFETPPPPQPPGPPSFAAPGTPQRPPRPATATAAVALMFTQIVLSVAGTVVPFVMKSQLVDAFSRMPTKPGQPKIDPNLPYYITVAFSSCVTVVVVIVLAVLAVFLLRGSNVARIVTWVFAGLGMCLSAIGLVSANLNSGTKLPSAYIVTSGVLGGLQFLVSIAVVVLLALPPSNAFFKPKAPGQLY
jgi:hypothetical protein